MEDVSIKFNDGSQSPLSQESNVNQEISNDAIISSDGSCFKKCHRKHNEIDDNASVKQKLKYVCSCPPHGYFGAIYTYIVLLLLLWAILWSFFGETVLPTGNIFSILLLFIFCSIGGKMVGKLHLPPLLGMLLVGFILRNAPIINTAKYILPFWSSSLRSIALVIILIRAGLGLDMDALKKLSVTVFCLAFIPCLVETVVVAVSSHFMLGFPWLWGFMLGFVISAVSPAVVVPSMLSLQEKRLGTDQGIPTLIIASASIDDVLAISGFGVMLGISFSHGSMVFTIFKGPLEAILGILYGIILGLVLWFIPPKDIKHKLFYKAAILLLGGLVALFASRKADLSGAGALGCLTLAFVAAMGWRKHSSESDNSTNEIMAFLWTIFQPLLFGLIGAEVKIDNIQIETLGYGIAVLMIGVLFRLVASILAVSMGEFSIKEKIFISIAWLPKATVQAAIGSVALDTARETSSPDNVVEQGIKILTIAVLAILITAPLGAAAIKLSAPKLLTKHRSNDHDVDDEL